MLSIQVTFLISVKFLRCKTNAHSLHSHSTFKDIHIPQSLRIFGICHWFQANAQTPDHRTLFRPCQSDVASHSVHEHKTTHSLPPSLSCRARACVSLSAASLLSPPEGRWSRNRRTGSRRRKLPTWSGETSEARRRPNKEAWRGRAVASMLGWKPKLNTPSGITCKNAYCVFHVHFLCHSKSKGERDQLQVSIMAIHDTESISLIKINWKTFTTKGY